jgi:transposase
MSVTPLSECPYCGADAERSGDTWYFDCENGHTYHADDHAALLEG